MILLITARLVPSKIKIPDILAANKQHVKAVEKMKKICKQAGIKIPPNIYRGKAEDGLREAFEALLEKYELSRDSSTVEISMAAKRIQKDKDLEGLLPFCGLSSPLIQVVHSSAIAQKQLA